MPFYAVAKGKKSGIYNTWSECQLQVTGVSGCIFKKFENEKEAENFIKQNIEKNNIEISTNIKAEAINPSGKNAFDIMMSKNISSIDYYVYTDGACLNNGQSNARAGIGIYFGENDSRNVSLQLPSTQKQTNNVAELEAILQTYPLIENDVNEGKVICIVSDSEYAIRCLTTYGASCESGKWKKEIPNKELVQKVYMIYKGKNIQWMHIRAHTGKNDIHSIGNDGADKLANGSIGLDNCPYMK
jgi:ribonuclease HI